MKTIIAGGRDYVLTDEGYWRLDELNERTPFTEVVCGMARGVDSCGLRWARSRGIPVKEFPADWDSHGKAAGPIRNAAMANYADALVAFFGGTGTNDMVTKAKRKGLVVEDWREIADLCRYKPLRRNR